MNRFMAGVALTCMVVAAHATAFADDTTTHEIKFDFKSSSSLSHWLGLDGASASVPQLYEAPASAHGNESGYLLLNSRRQETWVLREQLFESLGQASIMPQGSFMAGNILTTWHLSAPDEETVVLKFSARF